MKKLIFIIISIILCQCGIAQTAAAIVDQCLEAHGGKATIATLHYLKTTFIQHTNLVEQSERPSGPYILEYQNGTRITDLQNQRFFLTTKMLGLTYGSPDWMEAEYRYEDKVLVRGFKGRWYPMNAFQADHREQLNFSFEQVLLGLLEATSLQLEGKQLVQEVDNWKIKVHSKNGDFTAYINCGSQMLTAVEYQQAYKMEESFFWAFWGDYTTQVFYSSYNIFAPGILFPLQTDVKKHGWDYRSTTIMDMEVNPTLIDTIFNIPADIKQTATAQMAAGSTSISWQSAQKEEVTQGVYLYKGAWNVTFIEQKDGIVIIEAPISTSYCAQAIQAARQQFPNKPIKAVITTSDAWPHFGGLRQYVAEKIPVYALQLNKPIIDKHLKANFKTYPDALAKQAQSPQITWVSQKNVLKDEQLPVEIYPISGEGGERMLMVYFPKQQILYASDLVQKNSRTGEFFMPGYLVEVKNAAKREGLNVKKVFAMHTAPIDWSELENAIKKSK